MLIVDDQSGSKGLYPYIRALTTDAILTRIDPPFGDIAWVGNGPDEKPLTVGVEYKKWDEVLKALTGNDTRLVAHQIGGMIENYDRRYLLVEGRLRVDRQSGTVQELCRDKWCDITIGGRRLMYRDLEHWYTTIEEQAQFRVVKTFDEYESARWLFTKHSWYVYKGWDDHDTLKQFNVPPPPAAALVKPNLVRRVAKELDGIRWEKSIAVAARFKSVREMANASEGTWREIDGIGKVMSARIVADITGTGTGNR